MRNFKITVNGVAYDVTVEETGAENNAPAVVNNAPAKAPAAPLAKAPAGKAGSVVVKAPMPGNIIKVNVNPGDSVKKGSVLCVLEAMKMENEIMAPQEGTVVSVNVKKGDSVATDAVIVTLD